MPEPEKITEPEEKVFMGGMGMAINQYLEEETPDEEIVADELKFGDEGYVLKEGDEGYIVPEPDPIDYTTFEKDDLVNKVIEFEKLASEREQSISQLKTDLEAKPGDTVSDDELVKSLSEDFLGNYSKVQEKYELPSLSTLRELVSEGGTIDDKIKSWQEKELVKSIEQKHSLEEGEFEYDSNEASKAGTPSYDWDTQTQDKRGEMVSLVKERQGAERSRLRAVEDQQKTDLKWLAENYYGTEDVTQQKLTEMNEGVNKISKGEETADKHPFAIRNLMRGYFFDELMQSAIDKAVEELTTQFAEHNMHLPSKELPTDVSKVKNPRPDSVKELDIPEAKRKVSPMLNLIYKTANANEN